MNAPARTTIVYGLICAMVAWPAAGGLAVLLGWAAALRLTLWLILAGYAMLLTHWSGRRKAAASLPLGLLLGAALWSGVGDAFFLLALGVLSWIRSGTCFQRTPFRALVGEVVTIAGGAGLVVVLLPGTAIGGALGLWLFSLIQSLYFFIVPSPSPSPSANATAPADPFENASRNIRHILDSEF